MSVAETPPIIERPSQSAQQTLTVGSIVGAVLLLAGLGLVFAGLPWAWTEAWKTVFAENQTLLENDFLSFALLILVEIVVIGVLCFATYKALQSQTQPGLRAGIVFYAVVLFLAMWAGVLLGGTLEEQFSDNLPLGAGIVIVMMLVIAAAAAYVYLKVPGWMNLLETVEHQGWFHATPYKGNQGVRVRRGTIMGIIAVAISGIIVLVLRRSFGYERVDMANDWEWLLPFTEHDRYVPLMYKVHVVMPIALGILAIWFAWRVVNMPNFGDFLIATEAEMNKVSWTTRRRLYQDTIVVLTTVLLFTAFLFVVDVVWIKVLSWQYIRVLLVDVSEEKQKQQQKAEW